jgi:hypothetical protein
MRVAVSHVRRSLATSDIMTFRLGFCSRFQPSQILTAGDPEAAAEELRLQERT